MSTEEQRRRIVDEVTADVAADLPEDQQDQMARTKAVCDTVYEQLKALGHEPTDSGQMMIPPFVADCGFRIGGHVYSIRVAERE